ncbi:hypothetical protein [Gorillibacterium sp. CAU 1737]|uniref:hypothetical protein n=1 Tax=Gorillibacterium sp. CAU 1737 TaxID=3140362 RepID=UPI003261C113
MNDEIRAVTPASGSAEGKPLKVLSTSLGIALFANAFLGTGAAVAEANSSAASADEPQLVSWSTEEVKAYFDKNADWSLPLEELEKEQENAGAAGGSSAGAGTGSTTVINHYGGYHSGFGWDDVLLYHMLFNSGSRYSTTNYYADHRGYYAGSNRAYKPTSFTSDKFQNKAVAGSAVKPKTSSKSGTFKSRSTSSKSGSIGGTSSVLSSSSSSSKSSSGSSSSKSYTKSSKSSFSSKGSFGG